MLRKRVIDQSCEPDRLHAEAEPSHRHPAVDPASPSDLSVLDIEERLAYLQRAFDPSETHSAPPQPLWQHSTRRRLRRLGLRTTYHLRHAWHAAADPGALTEAALANPTVRKVLKTAAALAVAIWIGWSPTQRLLQTSSVEAVVNARLVTLRAPIDGEISAAPGELAVGSALAPGAALMRIINRRADRTRLDDLRRSIGRLEDERSVLTARLENARTMHAEFVTQTSLFQKGRIAQLEARVAETRSDIAASVARNAETTATLQRTTALEAKGAATRATLEKAQRDDEIAAQAIAAAQHRLKGVQIELGAARTGFFLGDSYNDRPRSAQRADELEQQVAELSAELQQRKSSLVRLSAELLEEEARYADQAEAEIDAPSPGSVWEVLTAPGEEVRRGQDLVRLLDCNTAVVTATVAESVYNTLRVGQQATFRFREGGGELQGRVVHLTGVAAAPANFAIAPSALMKEAYRVTVAVPGLEQSSTCQLGRTGRVIFGKMPAATPARGT